MQSHITLFDVMYAICKKCKHIFRLKKRKKSRCSKCYSTRIEYITDEDFMQRAISTKSTEKKKIKKKEMLIDPQIRKDFIKFNRTGLSIKANKEWIASRYGIKRDKAEKIATFLINTPLEEHP